MSQNVKKLLEAYELLNTRFVALKGGDIDDLLAFFDPEVVIEMVDTPDPETYHGHDGVRRWHRDMQDAWGGAIRVEPERYFDCGGQLLMFWIVHGRGSHSGWPRC